MDPRVQEYIDRRKKVQYIRKEKEKADTLIKLGLYEKVYSLDGKQTSEYSYCEKDPLTGKDRYYKAVVFKVTDEEYNEILRVSNTIEKREVHTKKERYIDKKSNSNVISVLLSICAVLCYSIGFIIGCIAGVQVSSFIITLLCWCIGFLFGSMLLGLAEIIDLLVMIKNK